ncbi:hypothetical protein [Nonomuraea sp. NPDC003709]|uniref:hypothetical protein n=1 Tax=Nonomuraea sp. NPDC003709 TaxID=3154450 RepID=UPI0033B58B0E
MSPRSGGESDKFGNRYEGAWTVRHVLYVLAGHGDSITVEDKGDLAEGVEFTYRRSDAVEVHQLKRQHGTVNNWSVASLNKLDIWKNARHHVEAGREYHFASTIPAQVPHELCDFARRSKDLKDFIENWLPNKSLRDAFDELSSPQVLGSAEMAWTVLRGTWIEWPDERDVVQVNAALAGLLLEGASGLLAAVGLGDLVVQDLGVELTESAISERLQRYGLRRATAIRSAALIERVNAVTAGWSASVATELLQPVIVRYEAAELERLATGTNDGLVFLVGAAGGGKTGVLWQVVEGVRARGLPVLVVRLDRLEPFASTVELGARIGLDVSPVAALAAAAGERSSLLVIDQLDAVSLASGRMPRNFDVIADLIREASAFKGMQVILACRKFDVDNDERIRGLAGRPNTATVTGGPLSDDQVDAAVSDMGLDATALTPHQRMLLRSPLHLVLLATVASEPGALDFQTIGHLFDAYWDRKRRQVLARRADTRFGSVVFAVAEAISQYQRLSVPVTVLDRDDLANDADVLASEHVLVRDGREVAFFHEAFFDYAFARHWVSQRQSLVEFLTHGEQELFRRAQVRQIMTYLRESDPGRFIDEVRGLLTSHEIRVHIKAAALAVLGGIADPTTPEADMLLDVAAAHPAYEARLWSQLCTPAWFARLDADGHVANLMRSGEDEQHRALYLMAGVAGTSPDRLAELLTEHRDTPAYAAWLRRVVRFAKLGASRPLFELFLDAIRCGYYDGLEHDFWLSVDDLAEEHPHWAVEVLVAFLIDRHGRLELNERGHVAVLKSSEYRGAQLVRKVVTGAPRQFCDAVLPYLLQVMEVTAYEHDGEGQRPDAHFSHRYPETEPDEDLDDVIFNGMAAAIRSLVETDPAGMRPTLERLAVDPHESAQWLLYQGLIAGRAAYAEWAAELLLEGRHRFLCGYTSNAVWTTRQVMETISPHISDELFSRLEAAVRDLRFSWEQRRPGWYAFNLLSALEERRLSQTGRRRLGELRRAVEMEKPPEPKGVVGGLIGPPIPSKAAPLMSDDNWLQAMAKHAREREDWRSFTGGAREMSHVLREQTKQDPGRFARLALRLTPDLNPAYGDAILMGLGDAKPLEDEAVVFDAVRHIASFGHSDNDRWLGWALRSYVKTAPLGMAELIRDRLIATTDPSDDGVRVWSADRSGRQVADIRTSGINTARGSLTEALADLLVYDVDGARTALATPILDRLAEDPAIPVRTCVARLIGAAMRHARPAATEAFWRLIETDDVLFVAESVIRVLILLGNEEPMAVRPVVERVLASADGKVREVGGQLAAFAAMEWGVSDYLEVVLAGADTSARKGAAGMAAHLVPHTTNAEVAITTLAALADDVDDEVPKEAAKVAGALRGHALRPFERVIKVLVASPAFAHALPQLLITLERAPDRVDDLALLCAQRFVEVFSMEAGDIRTTAAGNAREVGELIIRGLAQSRTSSDRAALLDVLDQLLLVEGYGVDDLISGSER